MVFNVMIQLCKITRASKLFQRNFFLPLLKPLSPKDALRRKILTGQNVLGSRIEHYIPVLEEYLMRLQRRKYAVKGAGKKRLRKKANTRYLMPLFDENMENHDRLLHLLSRKSKGKGQCYTYYVPDKDCTLVFSYQLERAIRDKEIIDVVIAQRSEKIVVKLKDGTKVTLPLLTYDGRAPFYRGEGWTKKDMEEHHHHGKETMSIARLFEAKEQGLDEWELEMMRIANKRKKKTKGEGTADWKQMMTATVANMDWDNFEEETKQIVEEINEPVDDEPIPMQVDNMEKTKFVNEKLKEAGDEVLSLLPTMPEIPECVKVMREGSLSEIANISGMSLNLPSSGKDRFVPGQIVSSEDGELFVPGQTVEMEDGSSEYTPGFTVIMDNEPTLLPGLVMGDDPSKLMFLPGESTITESGELQFAETEDDIRKDSLALLPEVEEVEEVELEEEQNSEEEKEEERPKPPPKREKKELIYERPKRVYATESMGPKRRERSKKAAPKEEPKPEPTPAVVRVPGEPMLYDMTVPTFEKDLLEQEKERVENFNNKKAKEEVDIDKKRREIRIKLKQFVDSKPPPPVYEPLEPVKKSEKLKELEKNIKKGKFFDVDYKKYLNKEYPQPFMWNKMHEYRHTFDSVGIMRHRVWKSVIYKLFQRNYYLPLLKPLSPKDALRRKIITGQNILGARIEHYIPVLTTHEEKSSERKKRGKGTPVIKKRIRKHESMRYVEPFLDENMENHMLLQSILNRKPKGKGQHYTYEILDKGCTLVIPCQMEKAVKDKEIIDITMAQRSEKILVKLSNGLKVTVPVASYNGNAPLYRGSGWTKETIEEEHHHGKETMSIAKLFEAKESGVEEWELEMMRLANKRKKKVKGEDAVDWKQMMSGCLENMDWDKFEEDTKQIVEESSEIVEEEDIPMAVDDMEKTKNVGDKLKQGGDEILSQLPTMKEIPEVIKILESGEMCELQNVSGVKVKMNDGRTCFITGQMVKSDENEVFVPGQTVETEGGNCEYTPGITIYMDNEPTLIPGLVFGEEEQPAMFLPGESTITEKGQLKFEVTEDDLPPIEHKRFSDSSPSPPPETKPKPKPKKDEEIVIRRRVIDEPEEPVRKERVRKKPPVVEMKPKEEPRREMQFRPQRQPLDDPLILLEEQRLKREEEEKKRQKERMEEKILKEESKVDSIRMSIRKKFKELKFEPPPPYVPIEPVKKSQKLVELERSIRKGTFFEDDKTKEILEKARSQTRMLKYQHALNAYTIHNKILKMVNYVLSFCKITAASRIFSRNFYLPLLKPLTPKEALRTFRITGKWLLGAKIQHYIPVLLNHKKKRSRKVKNFGKKPHKEMEDYTYMTPVLDSDNESHKLLLTILDSKKGKGNFVYTVDDKKYNIVLQAQLEKAILDGDVIDVLVSQRNDKIIVKLKSMKKIPMEIEYYDGEDKLYCGEGATCPEDEKFHHHGKYTMSLAKIFEDKELQEEKWEEELRRIMRRRKRQAKEGSKEWKEMMKESIKNLDWNKFEEEAKKIIDEIDEPAVEQNIDMEIDDLESTKNVNETILKKGPEMLDQLPTMKEIPDIIRNMGRATFDEIEIEEGDEENGKTKRRVSGVRVTLPSGKECFISGQMVHTEDGDVFVPGQTVENEFGLEYAPGITINVDNKPTLISGLIMGEEEHDPMFLPTQSTITSDGQLTFATTVEERPKPQPEKQKLKKKQLEETIIEETAEMMEEDEADDISDVVDSISSSEEKSLDVSSIELNNSEIEELDIEAHRLKQEQQRLEIEKLKSILMDDGLDDILASIEDKREQLRKKLEELRKLSVATENSLVSYVSESDTIELASKITSDKETINRLSDILMTIARRAATFRDKNSVNADNINQAYISVSNLSEADMKFNSSRNKLKVMLKTAAVAANDVFKTRPKDQILALNAIGDIIIEVLKNDDQTLADLLDLMNTPMERAEICNAVYKQLTQNITDTKITFLNDIITNLSAYDVIDRVEKVLKKQSEIKCEAFVKIAKVDPEIINYLDKNIKKGVIKVKTEEDAIELLEESIEEATRTLMKENLSHVVDELEELQEEAVSFARALGMGKVEEILSEMTDLDQITDSRAIELLERTNLIRQLAERDFSLKSALERIKKSPERGRSDPRIRQLIRESAVLISRGPPLKSSRDIPLQMLKNQNLLAIEDLLIQRIKVEFPVLISRDTFQAVIPKEAARGVLSGRVPYVLINENGVTNINPTRRFSADVRIDDFSVRERSSEKDDDRKYLQAKSNGTDFSWGSPRSRRAMSSGSLYRGYTGPRA
ncbi:uncharacterized protein LOC123011810 [Tribolium madens]|uniref:uncharacterized protein LOC123011810 n=1 Tax=Tribolium madens TaxID=41895 RepID=UPI001CF736E0|nr:uncharacterized protein LOC123011810 [Tribolium madens]